MTTKKFTLAALPLVCLHLSSCFSVAPVHGSYERAKTLGKGNLELSGNYTKYLVKGDDGMENINNNIGFKAGVGLSDGVDIKVRYENLMPPNLDKNVDFGANYFSVIPKFSLMPGKLSLFTPISLYSFKTSNSTETEKSTSYSIAAHLIQSFTSHSNKVDFSPSLNLEYLINKGSNGEKTNGNFLMGLNVGAGFSDNLNKWAVRPEVGYLYSPDASTGFWNIGVGLQFILPTASKAK
jgi:hypothetical protein